LPISDCQSSIWFLIFGFKPSVIVAILGILFEDPSTNGKAQIGKWQSEIGNDWELDHWEIGVCHEVFS